MFRCKMSKAVFDEAQFDGVEFKESDLTELSAKRIVLKGPIISLTIEDCNHTGMVATTNQIQFMNKRKVTKMWPEGLKE